MSAPKKSGFTLIELLVVISIIAILSAIGMTVFSGVQKGARDARRKGDIDAISKALEIYKSLNGLYPAGGWYFSDSANPWIPGLDNNYMVATPKDPTNTGGPPYSGGYTYGYYASNYGATNGTWFMLVARLEAGNNADGQTQCRAPDGTTFNYSTATYKTFMVCNQQ